MLMFAVLFAHLGLFRELLKVMIDQDLSRLCLLLNSSPRWELKGAPKKMFRVIFGHSAPSFWVWKKTEA
jgi:hypothetical protein